MRKAVGEDYDGIYANENEQLPPGKKSCYRGGLCFAGVFRTFLVVINFEERKQRKAHAELRKFHRLHSEVQKSRVLGVGKNQDKRPFWRDDGAAAQCFLPGDKGRLILWHVDKWGTCCHLLMERRSSPDLQCTPVCAIERI